jgi:hypothetical protein
MLLQIIGLPTFLSWYKNKFKKTCFCKLRVFQHSCHGTRTCTYKKHILANYGYTNILAMAQEYAFANPTTTKSPSLLFLQYSYSFVTSSHPNATLFWQHIVSQRKKCVVFSVCAECSGATR